jgi:L-ascorbate metabolism protein UlaG (beta-lactamase superfamily)
MPFLNGKKSGNHPRQSRKNEAAASSSSDTATKVGLKPRKGWHRRNFVTEVLIPSIFTKRSGEHRNPAFSELSEGQICVTWIGHASFLIRTRGFNMLIDPNWSNWLKVVKRMKMPGLKIHDLPNIDLVLVTHAHFDHLDRKTLRAVAEQQPIVVPFDVGDLVHDLGFHCVHELNYWQTCTVGPAEVQLTPCHHWGARVLHDSHRGFGGYLIKIGNRTLFHCGDTAYFDGFREIGARANIDLALLPIGAYEPPSGREVHMNPEEAAQAFVDLRAGTLIPMHYGTFRLSYEPLHEPPARLRDCAKKFGIADRVRFLVEGESVVF